MIDWERKVLLKRSTTWEQGEPIARLAKRRAHRSAPRRTSSVGCGCATRSAGAQSSSGWAPHDHLSDSP